MVLRQSRAFVVPPAGDDMIIDHADRLAEGIEDRRTAEFETALLKVFRDFQG